MVKQALGAGDQNSNERCFTTEQQHERALLNATAERSLRVQRPEETYGEDGVLCDKPSPTP